MEEPKVYQIIGTDERRGDDGFSARRYIAGEIKASTAHTALYRWLASNGLHRVDYTEVGSVSTKTTYEAREKRI